MTLESTGSVTLLTSTANSVALLPLEGSTEAFMARATVAQSFARQYALQTRDTLRRASDVTGRAFVGPGRCYQVSSESSDGRNLAIDSCTADTTAATILRRISTHPFVLSHIYSLRLLVDQSLTCTGVCDSGRCRLLSCGL
mmetsp:Transcript_12893/g.47148  ORF Transcript_12893/g.47148 Transcript_12893/m.47148 type:complete len:141 (+) Transcript_12893:913-1335(+)